MTLLSRARRSIGTHAVDVARHCTGSVSQPRMDYEFLVANSLPWVKQIPKFALKFATLAFR